MPTILLILFYAVPLIIIFWILVRKAGQPGWSQIIPFWSYYILGVAGRNKRLGFIVIGISVVSILVSLIAPKSLSSYVDYIYYGAVLGLWITFARQYTSGVGKWLVFLLVPIVGVFLTGKTQYKNTVVVPLQTQPAEFPTTPTVG